MSTPVCSLFCCWPRFRQRPKNFTPPLFMTMRQPTWPQRVKMPASFGSPTADLKRATRFEVKPQGVCRDELCFPLPKARQQEFVRKTPPMTWFNMTAFAGLVHQPVAHDAALATWYFGLRSDQRQQLSSLQAPDFTLPDLQGKPHRLSDFRGKKILLVTWASW